jgi:uncharacterized protein with HEPN domain
MARKVEVVLAEILEAIDGIDNAVAGKTLADFEQEWLLKHGVQRGIEIISEAARHIPPDLRDRHPEIPWKQVIAMGSVLRHEYHRIADAIVWGVVTDDLSALKAAVAALLRGLGE